MVLNKPLDSGFTSCNTLFSAWGTNNPNVTIPSSLTSSSHITILAVYVDDIILTGSDSSKITLVKTHLDSLFGIKDLGILHYFLGMEVVYLPAGTFLS